MTSVVEFGEQRLMQFLPDACLLPVSQASPAGGARAAAHFEGQHLPGNARLEDEQDAAKSGAV